jgi:leader peptidase (prepilin peptidase)/N-methyltransferase
MGLGDVKFIAAIGAFLGWQGAIFTFFGSAVIGSIISVGLMALRRLDRSGRIPLGPFLVLAATLWIFLPPQFQEFWAGSLRLFGDALFGSASIRPN